MSRNNHTGAVGSAFDISAPNIAAPAGMDRVKMEHFKKKLKDPAFVEYVSKRSQFGKCNGTHTKHAKNVKISLPRFSWDQEPTP